MQSAVMEARHHTAVITGATSGIGKAFASEYAKKGLDLIITGRRKEELLKVANILSSGNTNLWIFFLTSRFPDTQ